MADVGVNKNLGIVDEVTLSSSPRLSKAAFDTVKKTEESGIALNSFWTFWLDKYHPTSSVVEYEQCLRRIYKVGTVQGFWSVFNNIPDVSKLKHGYSYHLMRNDRRPVWEDEVNAMGGTWKFKCSKLDSPTVWKEVLLALIGEQLSDCVANGDEIIGASINIRDRDDIIQLWNKDAAKHETAHVISKMAALLPDVSFQSVFYKEFQMHNAFRSKPSGGKADGHHY